MRLNIFPAGSVEEVNAFIANNITLKFDILKSGEVCVWSKPFSEIGITPIDKIEEIDRLINQSEKEILASTLNRAHVQKLLDEVTAKLEKTTKEMKEWDQLDSESKSYQKQIKQDTATIEERAQQVEVFKAKLPEILAEIGPLE